MLISIWLPIIITIIGALWLFILGRIIPGPFDEVAVTTIVLGSWIAFAGGIAVESAINSALSGNITSMILLVIVAMIVVLYIKRKR